MTAEAKRLAESPSPHDPWRYWGPYVSSRQWGTVREDYSEDGNAWEYFPHDHARSRAYRWGEDGIFAICDRQQRLCFGPAFWNGADPILKERFFGLSGPQGNHGEDVKEEYWYFEGAPTASWLRALYRYPQREFPYAKLVSEGAARSRHDEEYELRDTGVFAEDRYFDIEVCYAKAAPDDIHVRIVATNRGPDSAPLWILPTLWFRNRWSWDKSKPKSCVLRADGQAIFSADETEIGTWLLEGPAPDEVLFTENETNGALLFGTKERQGFTRDAFHRYLVNREKTAVNPAMTGTKAAAVYVRTIEPGDAWTLDLRLSAASATGNGNFEEILQQRSRECAQFYDSLAAPTLGPETKAIQRAALAGLEWNKQFYHYDVRRWVDGDPAFPPPRRKHARNSQWQHFIAHDVISMPDDWEYPWFACWDLAFHTIPLALADPAAAKSQLKLLLKEWYMHPNGRLPAYEWDFGDPNPPVYAWAVLRTYFSDARRSGRNDRIFLEHAFHALLVNFAWWANAVSRDDQLEVFGGGFLGLDNASPFDRSAPLPQGGYLVQSDGTGWMAMYALNMLLIALELARDDVAYQQMAGKFLMHFLYIGCAFDMAGRCNADLWDEEDGFFYDKLHLPDGRKLPLKLRSIAGLVPLFAVETVPADLAGVGAPLVKGWQWFLDRRPDLAQRSARWREGNDEGTHLFSLLDPVRFERLLRCALDEKEFLGPYGIRSLSLYHRENPYELSLDGATYRVEYAPGESDSGLFGGNSNWRGPVWMPVNFLLIESLRKYHTYYGDGFTAEFPTGSGRRLNLGQIADELTKRITSLFLPGPDGTRPCDGGRDGDPLLFHEYFHAETGRGLGASHQTGWTACIADLLQR